MGQCAGSKMSYYTPGTLSINSMKCNSCKVCSLWTRPASFCLTHLIFFRFIRHCTSVTALAPLTDTPQPKPWQLSGQHTARRFSLPLRCDWLFSVSWLWRVTLTMASVKAPRAHPAGDRTATHRITGSRYFGLQPSTAYFLWSFHGKSISASHMTPS